jgi:hypothetical protein
VTIPTLLVIGALILALIEEWNEQGRSILAWAVVLVCLSLLWGNVSL